MNIFSTNENLDDKVGKVITVPMGTDGNGNWYYNQRFYIKRRATREEYLAQEILVTPHPLKYFYEALTD